MGEAKRKREQQQQQRDIVAGQVAGEARREAGTSLATIEEAMVRWAVQQVERIEGKLREPADEYIAGLLRARLRRGLTDRQRVIDAANNGDLLSHQVLMAEFHEMLDANVMPPASLREYARHAEKHPKRGKGRVWYDNWSRVWGFMLLIVAIGLEFSLNPTRNSASEGPSATSIAAIALRRKGFKGVSESRLKNLWGQLGDITIEAVALWRSWPEIMPYIDASGDPANFDLEAILGPYRKK
jgi:hypothetical protein